MGTDAHLIAFDAPDGWENLAIEMLWELGQRWDPNNPDSEVGRLNAFGELAPASDLTFSLFEAAENAYEITGARFDPTGGSATWTSVVIDHATQWLTLQHGAQVNMDILARGFAADLVASEVLEAGASSVLVNLGGDVRTTFRPDGVRWTIGIDDPRKSGALLGNVALGEGAIATVSTDAWRNPVPAAAELTSVTVVATEALWAAPLAHAAVIASAKDAVDFLEQLGLGALLLTANGELLHTSRWGAYAH
jgi:thiamine biosynthesis lipoprotein